MDNENAIRDGRSVEPLQTSDPESIDAYRLVGRLGTGGFGVVYAALGPDGQDVAIKALRRELSDDLELRQRLAREGLALRLVSGDRTVRVHDVVTTGEHAYLVMERLEGQSLDRHINTNGPLAGPELWFAAEALTEALADIHAAGIIHRDLKPSNIIYGPQGLKVLDFGVSVVADHTALTHTGAFIGTAAWISPEQISGQPATTCSDMFTLGLVLAFAATGRHPYGDGRSDAVMYRINHAQPNLDGISEPLREAIDRCLQRNTDDRPTTAQFAEFLRTNGQWPAEVIPMGEPVPGTSSPDATRVVQSLQPRPTQTPLPATPPVGATPLAGSAVSAGAPRTKRQRKRSLALVGAIAALAVGAVAVAVAMTQDDSTKTFSGSAASSTVSETSPDSSGTTSTAENQTPVPAILSTVAPTTTQKGQPRTTTAAVNPPATPASGGSSTGTTPPVIISATSVTPTSISGQTVVTISLHTQGSSSGTKVYLSVSQGATTANWCEKYAVLNTINTNEDEWTTTCTVPSDAAAGVWSVNAAVFGTTPGTSIGLKTIGSITVTIPPGASDTSPPTVAEAFISPTVATGSTVVTIRARVQDASEARLFFGVNQSNSATAPCSFGASPILVSGSSRDGVWSTTCTVAPGANIGEWTIYAQATDVQGNSTTVTLGTLTIN